MTEQERSPRERLFTVAEVAAVMRVSNMTVYRLIRSGELPALRVGKGYRIFESDLERFLEGGPSTWRAASAEDQDRARRRLHRRARRRAGGGFPADRDPGRAAAAPPGAVENGEVREAEPVSDTLRELWTRGGFKSRKVWMGVGNQRVVVREITLPAMPEKELRQSLGFQVQEFIPMPGRGGGPRLPPDRGARGRGPADAAPPGRGAEGDGRRARLAATGPSSSRWGSTSSRSRWCAPSAPPASAWTSRRAAVRRSWTWART